MDFNKILLILFTITVSIIIMMVLSTGFNQEEKIFTGFLEKSKKDKKS